MIELRQPLLGSPVQDILHAAAGRSPAAAEARRVRDGFGESISRDERQAMGSPLLQPDSYAVIVCEALARFQKYIAQRHDHSLFSGVRHKPAELIAPAGADVVRDVGIVGQVRDRGSDAQRLGCVALLLPLQSRAFRSHVRDLDNHISGQLPLDAEIPRLDVSIVKVRREPVRPRLKLRNWPRSQVWILDQKTKKTLWRRRAI